MLIATEPIPSKLLVTPSQKSTAELSDSSKFAPMLKYLFIVLLCLLPLASLSSGSKPAEALPSIIPENVELPDTVEQSKEQEGQLPAGYKRGAKSSKTPYGGISSDAPPLMRAITPRLEITPLSGSRVTEEEEPDGGVHRVPYEEPMLEYSSLSSPSSGSSSGSSFSHSVPEALPLESKYVPSCGENQTFNVLEMLFTSDFSAAYTATHTETGKTVLRKDILINLTGGLQEYEKQYLISEKSRYVPKVICVDFSPKVHSFEMHQKGEIERVAAWPTHLGSSTSLRKASVYMEYASKGDLQTILTKWAKQGLPMTAAQQSKVREWRNQAIQAVRSVHVAGWLHLDVKVENFVIDKDDNLKIIDFDFSLPMIEGRSRMTRPRGTKLYASPEVWDHDWVYQATDYYSVGAVIFVMQEFVTPPSMRTARFTARTPPKIRQLIIYLTSPIFQIREEAFSGIFRNTKPKAVVPGTKKESE